MLNLAHAVDRAHFSLRLVVVGRADELASELPAGIPVERLNAPRLRGGLFRLVRVLRRMEPAIVVSTLGYINLGLLAVSPLIGRQTRIIVREANVVSATLQSMPWPIPARRLYSTLYPRAGAILAQTDEIAEEIANLAPSAKSRIEILHNPVDENALRARAAAVTRIAGPGPRLVAAGRLTHQKGFDRLIALLPELSADTRLTIFGVGPDRAALAAQVEALGLAGRVRFPGFSLGLAEAIAGADTFVLPSRWEGMPNVALEALALGTPVIASNEAGLAGVAREAKPGAVTIAPVGPQFAGAIRAYRAESVSALRASLLPQSFRSEIVGARFNDLLAQVIQTPA
jgi:glycosyltransferase involved in cell wall biosynthesis